MKDFEDLMSKFNVNAMAQPKTREDLEVLAEEIIMELENINAHFDKLFNKKNVNRFRQVAQP